MAATACRIAKAIGREDRGDALVQLAWSPAVTATAEGLEPCGKVVVDRHSFLPIKGVMKDVAQQGERTAKGLAITGCGP